MSDRRVVRLESNPCESILGTQVARAYAIFNGSHGIKSALAARGDEKDGLGVARGESCGDDHKKLGESCKAICHRVPLVNRDK
jgi:hypothetical protein